MRINFVTVCTDTYPMEYARKLIKRVTSLSKFEFDCYCITDRPDEIKDLATPIKPAYKGWWNKGMVYSVGKNRYTLYIDLDVVITQSFDEEIEYGLEFDEHIVLVEDAINWMGNDVNTSFMVFRKDYFAPITKMLERQYIPQKLETFSGGDQVWLGKSVKPPFHKINIKFPNLKKSLKFDLGEKVFGEWNFPKIIDPRIKMIDCSGKPKPHELESLEYIRKNWHEI